MAVGTLLVLIALPTRSLLWTTIASVVALAYAWAALRIMWTEVLQSRRENAADRAAAATAYKTLFSRRAAEHAEFTTAMTERLAEAQLVQRELEGELAQQHQRAAVAETQLADSNRRLDETRAQLSELSVEHDRLSADHAVTLASLASLEERVAGKHSRSA